MGIMARYIDSLPDRARDRLIQAQEWCIAELARPDGSRCLVGHAEDWGTYPRRADWWRHWSERREDGHGLDELAAACSPELFAFRGACPADPAVYRERIRRWGLCSEVRIGARFDRLCARRGTAAAVRLVKHRAARAVAPMRRASSSRGAWRPPRDRVQAGVG